MSKKIPDFDRNYYFTIFHKIRIFSGFTVLGWSRDAPNPTGEIDTPRERVSRRHDHPVIEKSLID